MVLGARARRAHRHRLDWPPVVEPASGGAASSVQIARIAAVAGAAVVVVSTLGMTSFLAGLGFLVWSLVPYALLLVFGPVVRDPWLPGGAGAVAVTAELGVRASVFVFPAGSTAGLALIFSPILITVVAMPAGAAGGWLMGRVWRRTRLVGRALASIAAAIPLGLLLLGLARPDLFPTTVYRRQAQLKRLGEPRVISGADAFETVVVAEGSAWHTTGELDGAPGDEIAIIDHRGFDLLDPAGFRHHRRVEFGTDDVGFWNWPSTLARIGGRLVVVRTGGGFSSTELRRLDGELIWAFQPEADLPPTALRPADLDGDGETELYAADADSVVRLDAEGRVTWSRPATMASLVALLPGSTDHPAWVIATEYEREVRIWDADGHAVAVLPYPDARVLGAVDWRDERLLVLAGTAARGIDPAGRVRFEVPLGELTLEQATTVRFERGRDPHLVLVAAARRDVDRWRLLLVSPDGRTVYDELLGRRIQLLKARHADGRETLLLRPHGLRSLRPRGAARP